MYVRMSGANICTADSTATSSKISNRPADAGCVIVCNTDWKRYLNKNTGRHDFQIDLGIDLLNYGISLDWKGNKHPSYMRTNQFIPCDCKRCYCLSNVL